MMDINTTYRRLGIQDFMLAINSVRLLKFLISRGILFHAFGARYLNGFKP